ncbi:MAG: hypothetical protein ACREKB_02735, partial [Candidatus Rokuibacteriota bacterium]
MPDTIRKIDYYYTTTADKPGEGARVLGVLRDAGVNLLAVHAFPSARRTQLDFVPANAAAFLAAAQTAKIKLSKPKTVFLFEGDDRIGAMAAILGKLAAAKINATASEAVCTSGGRFAGLLWVKPKDVNGAAQAL